MRAEIAGHSIGTLCRAMHEAQAERAVRRIQGVPSLAKRLPEALFEPPALYRVGHFGHSVTCLTPEPSGPERGSALSATNCLS
jgi:hypothetical protein